MNYQDPRQIWEARFAEFAPTEQRWDGTSWLARWLPLLAPYSHRAILDLGCGSGLDSGYLTGQGYRVAAADFSWQALLLARRSAPLAAMAQLDLRQDLPFSAGAFGAILADLSLHYFAWERTAAIFNEVRRCLIGGGLLLARFNAIGDLNYGAQGYPQIEPGLFLVNGEPKRFLDGCDLECLLGSGWRVHHLAQTTIHDFGQPKRVWEVVAKKG